MVPCPMSANGRVHTIPETRGAATSETRGAAASESRGAAASVESFDASVS